MKKQVVLLLFVALLVSCRKGGADFDASGTFEATEIIVSSEANGKIMRFAVEEGQVVEAGEYLGYVDTVQLHLSKQQMVSSLQAVGARKQDVPRQIAALHQQLSTQRQELKRAENLVSAGAANQKSVDDLKGQIAVLEKQLSAQLSVLEKGNQSIGGEAAALYTQIEQIEDKIGRSMINSPIRGTVLAKYAEAGELTAVGKPLFKVADLQAMKLRAYITSGQLSQLQLGQKVSVLADYKDKESRTYEGTVVWISDKSEFTPKTIQTRDERANLVYAVKILVENDGFLKIGMYADVKF